MTENLRKRVLLTLDGFSMRCTPLQKSSGDVLFIRVDNIGDFVLWLDAARALTAHFHAQGRRVVLLANQVWAQMAVDCRLFDEVIPLHERRFKAEYRYRLRFTKQLRARGFQTAVRLAYTRVLELNESLMRICGAAERIGLEGVFDRGSSADDRLSRRWYTELFPNEASVSSEMRNNAALVRALTRSPYAAKTVNLRELIELTVPKPFHQELGGRRYFVLFPGATFSGRLWPAERFTEIARRISASTGWRGIVCGGPGEMDQAQRICAGTDIVNWTGKTTLTQLAAILAEAELLVGNESSAVHIAAAVDTHAVCLLGGGHFGRFVPYAPEVTDGRALPIAVFQSLSCFGCDWKCKFHIPKEVPVPCISEVSVERAWAAVQKAIVQRPALGSEQPELALAVAQCDKFALVPAP